ncbi:DUF4834 family protein [Capnocytophaga felis]|uniref:DUF4834 domain-containing protein n=1 Tax=Capnocytophaga felis TaxID=2267611 RepID=A0A5M4B6V9_9FLAO|nr:DUF4834 family protein [Capnocytophaga felis]GET45090.1 hypothetical protein RCZ01_03920 [Capnocytophaga felis]GET47746.1 hypothetical protein RCZ02_05770 [Capnocytophaga felis]
MITEASLSGFIKTLFVILLVIIGLRVFMRILIPYLMRYFLKKVEQKFGQQFQQAQNQYQQRTKESQTINDNNAQSKNPQSKKKVGDYIDYEEVD